MGLGDAVLLDDGDGGGCQAAAAVSCSICLEVVTDNGDRSWAKLHCGHQFHLDCIGSAFNVKGAMQCPNCRKIEKGQWLYANGSRSLPEFSMDDWPHDEDLYDLSYSEMSFWCPFSGMLRLPSSFDEGEYLSGSYHELLGHHAVFAEHTPVPSASHGCPYIAYIAPMHPSSSASSGSIPDGSSFNSHWSGPSVQSEVPNSYDFPSMDVHYHPWDHSSPFTTSNRNASAEQPSIPSVSQRPGRNGSDMARSGMHPFMLGHHGSASRAPSTVTSSVLPPYPGAVGRPRERPSSLQAYFQQFSTSPSVRTPVMPSGRRSSSHRGLAQVAPITSSDQPNNGFYFFSSSSSARSFQEAEIPHHRDRFYGWDREHPSSYAVDRDSIWGPFHPPADSGISRSRGRHGSERMPSQNWS